jgi:hypothetical protein
MFMGIMQASNLEIHEVPDGYIVYQKERDRVHYLNKTAAIIFEFCDGRREPQDIIEHVARTYALDPSAHDEIRAALDSLVQEELVLSSSV